MNSEKSSILSDFYRAFVATGQRIRNSITRNNSRKLVKNILKSDSDISLDLGCGPSPEPGFIGIDICPGAEIQWDLSRGIPFKDNSVTEIRSDHLLEHLELPTVVMVLRECFRALVPGGALKITVPHIDPYIEAYLSRDIDFLKEKIFDIPKGQEALYSTCFDRISWLLGRSGEHKSLFDKEAILAKVKLAGFGNVTARKADPAQERNYRFSSLYIVAIK